MSDWDDFCSDGWYKLNKDLFTVGPIEPVTDHAFRPSAKFEQLFPQLNELLNKARCTPVGLKPGSIDCFGSEVDRHPTLMYLLGWNDSLAPAEADTVSLGWVTVPPGLTGDFEASGRLHADHKILLESFGGINDYWGGWHNWSPSTLISNYYYAFVEQHCEPELSSWRHYYEYFQESDFSEKFENPIDASNYVVFAKEANGNRSAYHVESGAVILMATDHAFDYVSPLPGCPDCTLYTIDGCSDFQSWVEMLAGQWLGQVE